MCTKTVIGFAPLSVVLLFLPGGPLSAVFPAPSSKLGVAGACRGRGVSWPCTGTGRAATKSEQVMSLLDGKLGVA